MNNFGSRQTYKTPKILVLNVIPKIGPESRFYIPQNTKRLDGLANVARNEKRRQR